MKTDNKLLLLLMIC